MASLWTERILFLNDYMSYAQMARDYNIPYRTLLGVKNTGILPDGYKTQLNSLWRSESYSAMRSEGLPVKQASNLRGGAVDSIKSAVSSINELLDRWATGATLLKFKNENPSGVFGSKENKFYESIREQIAKSLSRNKTTAEDLLETNKTFY